MIEYVVCWQLHFVPHCQSLTYLHSNPLVGLLVVPKGKAHTSQ
jgi:hypothetical protein